MKKFLFALICLFAFPLISVELIPFSKGDKWGFGDRFHNIVYPANFFSVSRFTEGVAKVETQKGSYAFLYPVGTMRSELSVHHESRLFKDGMVAIQNRQSKKWGFADIRLKIAVPCIYDQAGDFSEGMAWVKKNGKTGYVNKEGELIIPLLYSAGKDFKDGLFPVEKDGRWGYIDKKGKIKIKFQYKSAEAFSEKIAVVSDDLKEFFFIDDTGKQLFGRKFDFCASFSEGVATVGIKDGLSSLLYGAINTEGKLVIPMECGFIYPFSEGKAVSCLNNKYGYIDKTGTAVIPFEYYFAEAFDNGYAKVWTSVRSITEKHGNVTSTMNVLSSPVYINHKNEKYICNEIKTP